MKHFEQAIDCPETTPISAMRFLDTNVLLYAMSTSADELSKSATARSILRETELALSVQVLQEFYVQATRPGKADALTQDQAVQLIESFLRFPVQEMTISLMRDAFGARRRFRISYWDAAIIEAARAMACDTVLSEDLNHGQHYDGIRVENPFR